MPRPADEAQLLTARQCGHAALGKTRSKKFGLSRPGRERGTIFGKMGGYAAHFPKNRKKIPAFGGRAEIRKRLKG